MHKQLTKVLYFGFLSTVFAVVIYWFLHPSVDDSSVHPDTLSSVATNSAPRTIETNQEFPTYESLERESELLVPFSKQVDAALTVAADASGEITEIDCAQSSSSPIVQRLPDIPAHLPFPFDYHNGATDDELLERVNANDGYAQQVYANRLQVRMMSKLPDVELGNDDVRERWEREFDRMEGMFISAIQNRSVIAARTLGDTLLMPTPRRDPVKAAAWLLIEQRMGGDLIVRAQNQGTLELTDELMEISELLAASYIEEHDLWFLDPALWAESGSAKNRECAEN